MPLITEYYGITGAVPFIDVDVSRDNKTFVDPHAIRLSRTPEPFRGEAVRCIDTFMDEVLHCVLRTRLHTRGQRLLSDFHEPWETRCGMSHEGFFGNGGREEIGRRFWTSLTTDLEALIRLGVLHHLEELPSFVSRVDRDITSDVTTRLIYRALAHFTEAMIGRYPEFTAGNHRTARVTRSVWNEEVQEWTDETFDLPSAEGRPLLLVPLGWARPHLLMSARRYYGKSILDFAQQEQSEWSPSGKLLVPPKRLLRIQEALAPTRTTNIFVTTRAAEAGENIVASFTHFVDAKFERVKPPQPPKSTDENHRDAA